MTTFTRVLWKEFRAQFHVWLALTIGILLLQVLIASFTIAFDSRLQTDAVEAMLAIVLVVGVCHCAASCAILFAGEREDETSFLLRTFPIPRGSLLGGKIAYVLLSALALLAVGTATALVIGAVGGAGPAPFLPTHGVIARSLIGVVAWGILFSLLLDRVINALGLAIIAEFAAVAVTGNLFLHGAREGAYWTIVLTVLALDAWLAWRWTAGWNFSLSDTFSNRASGGTRVSSLWLGMLRRFASAGMPASRATGALLWREIRSVVPFVLGFSLLGVLTIVIGMRWEGGIPFNGLFFFLLPIACGFMAGGSDQGRQTFRFLTDRGISPYRIWTIKIATWVVTGIGLTILFVGIDALANGGTPDRFGRRTVNFLTEIRQNLRPGYDAGSWESPSPEFRRLQDNFIASTWLLLFTVGQLSAFWHRKPVVGAAVGFGLSVLAISWQFTLLGADIPLWLSSWPLIAAGLAATAVMSPQWLLEDRSWPAFGRRAAWIVLPMLFVLLAARTHRITSVPVRTLPGPIPWETTTLSSSGIVDIQSPVLRELLAIDAQQTLKGSREVPFGHTMSSAVQTLTETLKPLREAGKLDEEWAAIRDMLAEIRRHSAVVDNWPEWSQCVSLTQLVLRIARDWAADPRQTDDLLMQAIEDVRKEDQVLTPVPMLMNRYVRWRQFLDGRDISNSAMGQYRLSSTLMALGVATGELERARRLLETITTDELKAATELMNDLDARRKGSAPNGSPVPHTTASWAGTWPALSQAIRDPLDLHRRVQTTILLPPELKWSGLAMSIPVQSQLHISNRMGTFVLTTSFPQQAPLYLAGVRGTEISLRLQRYYRRHGEFPTSLDDVGSVPSDPFSDAPFLYYPAGFPARLELKGSASVMHGADARFVVPARQPALLSVGPGDARIFREVLPDDHFEAVSRHQPIRTDFLLGDTFNDLNEKRVRFLILD